VPKTAETGARIRAKQRIAEASWLFTLESERALPPAAPGQFVQLEAPGPFALRRPFSVAGAPSEASLELLIEERGPATRALVGLSEGSEVPLSGPFGQPFDRHPDGADALLVAGGIGVAGLRLLAFRLAATSVPTLALVGARTADRLLDAALPEGIDVERATDDGSAGFGGTVCDLLRSLTGRLQEGVRVYACGPRAMIDDVGRTTRKHGMRASGLIEEVMACGVGACRGCVVRTRHGYRTVCKDGPVFDLDELVTGDGADD
jgi:dihydroorotate dehydrogenase electron transfer subunit